MVESLERFPPDGRSGGRRSTTRAELDRYTAPERRLRRRVLDRHGRGASAALRGMGSARHAHARRALRPGAAAGQRAPRPPARSQDRTLLPPERGSGAARARAPGSPDTRRAPAPAPAHSTPSSTRPCSGSTRGARTRSPCRDARRGFVSRPCGRCLIGLGTLARLRRAENLLDPTVTVKVPRGEVRVAPSGRSDSCGPTRRLDAWVRRLAAAAHAVAEPRAIPAAGASEQRTLLGRGQAQERLGVDPGAVQEDAEVQVRARHPAGGAQRCR